LLKINYYSLINTTFALFISIMIFIITIYYTYTLNFFVPIKSETIIIGSFDYIISLIVLLIIFNINSKKINLMKWRLNRYSIIYEKYFYIIIGLILYMSYKGLTSLFLVMNYGISREMLIGEYSMTGLDTAIIEPFILILFTLSFILDVNVKKKIFLFFGLVMSMLIATSRSELLFVIFFLLTLSIFLIKKTYILKFILMTVLFMITAIYITASIQHRPISNGFDSLLAIWENFFRYKAYSYYLAERAIRVSDTLEKMLYPMFGYISEKPLAYLHPTTAIDTKFVTEYMYLGITQSKAPMLANVLYPWWSWFYGVFGIFGIFIKNIFLFLLLSYAIKYKYYLTFIYFIYIILFVSTVNHPLLTIEGVFMLFTVLLFDYVVLKNTKRKYKFENLNYYS